MDGPSNKRARTSRTPTAPVRREYIDFSVDSSPVKPPRNATAGPSRSSKDLIVIDDDEEGMDEEEEDDDGDDDEEAAYYAEAYRASISRIKKGKSPDHSKKSRNEEKHPDEFETFQASTSRIKRSQSPARLRKSSSPDKRASRGMEGFEEREAIRAAIATLDSEMDDVRAQIQPLQDLLVALLAERRGYTDKLERNSSSSRQVQAGPSRHIPTVDYQTSTFAWTGSLLPLAKSTFNISAFRLCQQGVINAAIDGRDIVCVMPTGGGKSLTYQLPAVMGKKGLTVVISPLLALIWDQVRALKEIGVEAVMLTGGTSKEDQNEIYRRMEQGEGDGEKVIRLCYLTPEKVAKAKRLQSVLTKVNSDGRLRRFVIDEAHCCSQLGHDFRPDYKQLGLLKGLFPHVPIQAVTATLSTKTLPDLLRILRLPPICDGRNANAKGTVFFTAPLYRPNLHYKVLTKPASAKAAIESMGKWIQATHPGRSGIIYCLSKKDAEVVAESLRKWSNGKIRTGVYHAGVDDSEKERIHLSWRRGTVNCICATTAFGMGIDKGDVRYVIHHAMSKTLDGYYQETGRAGRDGKDSDCILFYRGHDASRLSGMVAGDADGSEKLYEMMRFAQDIQTCRKVAFAKYFSTSANLSANAWDNAATLDKPSAAGSLTTCGICDNCTRDESTIVTRDVTIDSWKIIKVLEVIQRAGGRATVSTLTELARGNAGGSFSISEGKKGEGSGTAYVDIDEVGGKITANKDDTERLIIHLILNKYLAETFAATAYTTNVYLVPSSKSLRLSRLSIGQVQDGAAAKVECSFLSAKKKAKAIGNGKKRARKEVVDVEVEAGRGDEEEDEANGTEDLDENGMEYAEDEDD